MEFPSSLLSRPPVPNYIRPNWSGYSRIHPTAKRARKFEFTLRAEEFETSGLELKRGACLLDQLLTGRFSGTFDGQSAFFCMLRLVAGTVLLFLMGLTEALAVEETKKDNIGPWEIEATFKNNKFDHCAISRKVDEVVASFLRTSDGLSLTLNLQTGNWTGERIIPSV